MYIDWTYIILVLPAVLFTMWASANVKSTYNKYSRQQNSRGMTGAQAARRVLDANGELVPEVDMLADYINSDAKATYTEISPSGTGLHVWYSSYPPAMNGRKSKLTLGKRKDGRRVGIEVYGSSDKRYLTVTGRRYKDAPLTLAEG